MTSEKKSIVLANAIDSINKRFYDGNERYNWKGYFRYYSYFFGKYLEEKYDNICYWKRFSIVFDISENLITDVIIGSSTIKDKHIQMLKEDIKKCSKRFIMIPIVILMHQNILIIDTKAKEIELFDSYGDTFRQEIKTPLKTTYNKDADTFYKAYITAVKKLTKEVTGYSTFYSPVDFFPEGKEFQNYEISSCPKEKYQVNSWGFCVIWAFFYAEQRVSNPDIPRKHLVNTIVSLFKKETADIDCKKGNKTCAVYESIDICKTIRGYTLFVKNLDKKEGIFKRFKALIYTSGKLLASQAIFFSTMATTLFAIQAIPIILLLRSNK